MFTIIAVCKFSFLREDCTCRFVASLACADLIAGIAVLSDILLSYIEIQSSVYVHLCKFKVCLHYAAVTGNLYNILSVTIDRIIYIHRPLRYISIVTEFRTSVSLIVLWVAIIVQVSMLLIFNPTINPYKPCTIPSGNFGQGSRHIMMMQLGVIALIVIPCQVTILWTAGKLARDEPHVTHYAEEHRPQQLERLRQRKMARTLAIISGLFLLCNIPVLTFHMIISKVYPSARKSFSVIISIRILKIILWMQSIINPFIYSWRNKSFRQAYRKLLPIRPTQVTPHP